MTTQDRLAAYNTFAPEVIQAAVELSEFQKSFKSYQDYFRAVGMPAVERFAPKHANPIQVVDIKPKGDFDETKARVYQFPFGCPPDNNMLYHLASIQGAQPETRLIGLPGWCGGNYDSGVLSRPDRRKVAQGDLRPTVEGGLQYIAAQGITDVEQIGYSFGASKAVEATRHANAYDHQVGETLSIEPSDVVRRSIPQLVMAFQRTNGSLEGYVQANEDPNYLAARKDSAGALSYYRGFARASSLAVCRGLAQGHYEERAGAMLRSNPETNLTIAWGSESELALAGATRAIVACLQVKHGPDRVNRLEVPGRHMLVNDLALQTAIINTALTDK